jgi:hypothetical protein
MAEAVRAPRRRRIARGLLVLCCATLATLALAELALRVWPPFPRAAPLYPGDREPITRMPNAGLIDPRVGWRLAGDVSESAFGEDTLVTYQTNADGFRAALERDAGDDPLRIVFLGDSFTFGTGVALEDTFVERVAAARPGLRTFNYAMAGYGVDQMWQTFVHFGRSLRPHLVVAVFVVDDLTRCLGSFRDRGDWTAKPTFCLAGGQLVARTPENSPPAFVRWIEQQLYLAEVWRRAENKYGLDFGFGRRFELNCAIFEALRDDCRAADCALVAVHLPQRNAWRPLPALTRAFRELEVPFFDLGSLPVDDPTPLYFERDFHIDADGHAFVAEQLTRFLLERGLLDRPTR